MDANKEDPAANVAPLSAHVLGKYFAWRGRKSTGFCYSILSPNDLPWSEKKGEGVPGSEAGDVQGKDDAGIVKDDRAPKSVKSDFLDFMRTYPEMDGTKAVNEDEEDREDPILLAASGIESHRRNMKPRHFKVHGKDAYENAMKGLGNVNTLFNRYGYDDSRKD